MKAFLIHAIEKDDFAYAIFEYSSDCEKMIKLLLNEWETKKTMERMKLLTENILNSQKKLTSSDLRKVFPLCFESDKVTITYNIRDIFDKEEFNKLSKKYEIYSYDLEKFNLEIENEIDDDDEIIDILKNIKIKNNKKNKKKKNKIIIIDDIDNDY